MCVHTGTHTREQQHQLNCIGVVVIIAATAASAAAAADNDDVNMWRYCVVVYEQVFYSYSMSSNKTRFLLLWLVLDTHMCVWWFTCDRDWCNNKLNTNFNLNEAKQNKTIENEIHIRRKFICTNSCDKMETPKRMKINKQKQNPEPKPKRIKKIPNQMFSGQGISNQFLVDGLHIFHSWNLIIFIAVIWPTTTRWLWLCDCFVCSSTLN